MRLTATLVTVALLALVSGVPLVGVSQTEQKAGPHHGGPGNLKLGFLEGDNEECGCEFTFASESGKEDPRWVFMSGEEEKRAFIRVDARNIEMKLIQSTNPSGRERVGSRSTRIYAGKGIRVSAVYVATKVCDVHDEACEITLYDGTFTLRNDQRKRTARLKGVCGC